jgi:hypothetical protein
MANMDYTDIKNRSKKLEKSIAVNNEELGTIEANTGAKKKELAIDKTTLAEKEAIAASL